MMDARSLCFLLSGVLLMAVILIVILVRVMKNDLTKVDEYREKYLKAENTKSDIQYDMGDISWQVRNLAGELSNLERQYENLQSQYDSLSSYCTFTHNELRDTRYTLIRELSKPEGVKFDSPDIVKQAESLLSWIKSSSVIVYPYFFLTFEASKEIVDATYKSLCDRYSGIDDYSMMDRHSVEETYKKIYSDHGWS